MSSKSDLRREKLNIRNRLTIDEIKEKSSLIVKRLKPHLKGRVGIFYPIKNEVDLLELLTNGIAFPKVIDDMNFFEYEGSFTLGKYDIPEPTGRQVEVDTIVVPGSVFDLKGYRIGYGGGYYDRYMKPHHKKIGVCFDFQVVDVLPTEAHDVGLDMLITESRIINFKE